MHSKLFLWCSAFYYHYYCDSPPPPQLEVKHPLLTFRLKNTGFRLKNIGIAVSLSESSVKPYIFISSYVRWYWNIFLSSPPSTYSIMLWYYNLKFQAQFTIVIPFLLLLLIFNGFSNIYIFGIFILLFYHIYIYSHYLYWSLCSRDFSDCWKSLCAVI